LAAALGSDIPSRIKGQWPTPATTCKAESGDILQNANAAIDEVRKAEFFRQGPQKRGLIKGKKWLLLSRWKNLKQVHRGELNRVMSKIIGFES